MVLLPVFMSDESYIKNIFEDLRSFLKNVDYYIVMNGVDVITRSPAIVTSAIGEIVYSLSVYLPKSHILFKTNEVDCK